MSAYLLYFSVKTCLNNYILQILFYLLDSFPFFIEKQSHMSVHLYFDLSVICLDCLLKWNTSLYFAFVIPKLTEFHLSQIRKVLGFLRRPNVICSLVTSVKKLMFFFQLLIILIIVGHFN